MAENSKPEKTGADRVQQVRTGVKLAQQGARAVNGDALAAAQFAQTAHGAYKQHQNGGGQSWGSLASEEAKAKALSSVKSARDSQPKTTDGVEKSHSDNSSKNSDVKSNNSEVLESTSDADNDKDGLKKAAVGGGSLAAGAAGGHFVAIALLLNWLKMLFFQSVAFAANIISAIIGAVMGVVNTVIGGIMGAGAFLATTVFGGAISATTGALVLTLAIAPLSAVGIGGIVNTVNDTVTQSSRDDSLNNPCSANVQSVSRKTEGQTDSMADVQANAKQLENAKKIYAILAGAGMSDENVAGILGNWETESGIDPTSVETVTTEPYTIGTEKKRFADADFSGSALPASYPYRNNIQHVGLGLGQWTNERNVALRDYAKSKNADWYDLQTQLNFMASEDSGATAFRKMVSDPQSSVEEATTFFLNVWEGNPGMAAAERQANAKKWFSQMKGWDKDEAAGKSLLSQSSATIATSNTHAVLAASSACKTAEEAGAGVMWNGDLGKGEWTNPCPGCVLVYPYKPRNLAVDVQNHFFHWGDDLATPGAGNNNGTEIIAPTNLVISEFYAPDGCLFAYSDTSNEAQKFGFAFCHLDSTKVKVGDKVKKGTIIGIEGGTIGGVRHGTSTHVHFEMYKPGFKMENFAWFNSRTGKDNQGGNIDPEPVLKHYGAWVDNSK